MPPASIALKIFWTIVLVLVGGGSGILLAIWFKKLFRVRADKKHSLKLVNNGNLPSLFHLAVSSTQPGLTFSCSDNNIPLIPVFEEVLEVPETQVVQEPFQQAAVPQKQNGAGTVKPNGALKAGRAVATKSGVLAGLLGTLGGLLPGKLGAGLKEKAALARDVQIRTASATQAPKTAANKLDSLKTSGSRLGVRPSENENKSQGGSSGSIAAASSPSQSQVVISDRNASQGGDRLLKRRDTGQVRTRELAPGESLVLTLKIGVSHKRYPVGSFNYVVRSQQVPVDGHFDMPAALSRTGTVYFKKISNFRYLVPFIGGSLVFLIALYGIYYGLTYLWG